MKKSILFLLIFCSTLVYSQSEGTPDIIRGDESFTLMIKVVDSKTSQRIDDTEVYLYKTINDQYIETKSTVNGIASFEIDPFVEYEIRTCHVDYFRSGLSIYECNEGNEILCTYGGRNYIFVAGGGRDKPNAILKATLALSPVRVGSLYELENVYYDLDKETLRPEAKQELDELAAIMKRNESITIELSSHTDSRASNDYNDELSQARARSCYDYLINAGISSQRIIPKGYGKQRLLNNCVDGVECTETQHQKNRRTEFEILTYQPLSCQPSLDVDFAIKDLKNDSDDYQ